MRLINTKTLELNEYFGNQIPPYAILSHTWQEEEVSFQDWADQSLASKKKGYKKIFDTCQLAKRHGHNYVWVDTNCIDKSSSSELTEAINSMFKWYQCAQVCYAYLFDVPSSEVESFSLYFRGSRWFTRGWTLQELLAPRDVEFYCNDWSLLGTKESLCSDISSITGIKIRYLWNKYVGDPYVGGSNGSFIARSIQYVVPLRKASVGERFSWLSNRTTTRLEDMAYCMLGIFELNMPLLYGEGSKAFTRLQEEIMKVSDDHSLFCWTWDTSANRGGFLSVVASEFKDASHFVPKQEDKRPAPYTFTNAGLSIVLPVLQGWQSSFIGILRVGSSSAGMPLSQIFGLPMSGDLKTGRVSRKPFPPEPIPLCVEVSGSQDYSLFVSEKYSQQRGSESSIHSLISAKEVPIFPSYEFIVFLTFDPELIVHRIKTYPPDCFNPEQSSISIPLDVSEEKLLPVNQTAAESIQSKSVYFKSDEGTLVQLELRNGISKSFMISSMCEQVCEVEGGIRARWKWHCWHVSPNDASKVLRGGFEQDFPETERFYTATKDPNHAQTPDSQVQEYGLSLSMAMDCLLIGNKAICHMHLA